MFLTWLIVLILNFFARYLILMFNFSTSRARPFRSLRVVVSDKTNSASGHTFAVSWIISLIFAIVSISSFPISLVPASVEHNTIWFASLHWFDVICHICCCCPGVFTHHYDMFLSKATFFQTIYNRVRNDCSFFLFRWNSSLLALFDSIVIFLPPFVWLVVSIEGVELSLFSFVSRLLLPIFSAPSGFGEYLLRSPTYPRLLEHISWSKQGISCTGGTSSEQINVFFQ